MRFNQSALGASQALPPEVSGEKSPSAGRCRQRFSGRQCAHIKFPRLRSHYNQQLQHPLRILKTFSLT